MLKDQIIHENLFNGPYRPNPPNVTPPSSFTHYGYGSLAREATISKHSPHATKPALPLIFSLNKPQATTDSDSSSVTGSVNDDLQIVQPQYLGSDFYDPCFMPSGQQIHHQAPTNDAFELVFAPQSFFTTFPLVPIYLPPTNGGFDFEALTKNFKQYELWGRPEENNDQIILRTEGSFYIISRSPFDRIGRPYNPFGPIARPVKNNFQKRQ